MGKGPRPGGHFLRVFGAIPQLVLVFGLSALGSFSGCLNVVLQTAPEWKDGSPMMLMMRVCWPQEAPMMLMMRACWLGLGSKRHPMMFPMCACWLRAGPTIFPTMLMIMIALQETADIRMPTRHGWFQLLFEEVGAEPHAHTLLLGLCRPHGNLMSVARSSRTTSASGPVLSFLVRLSRAIKNFDVCMSGCVCVQSHGKTDI